MHLEVPVPVCVCLTQTVERTEACTPMNDTISVFFYYMAILVQALNINLPVFRPCWLLEINNKHR